MRPTLHFRWALTPGASQHIQPVLEQWWEHDDAWARDPKFGEWRALPYEDLGNPLPPAMWTDPRQTVMD